ncbi:Nramp family divalent metal transporter [Microvirga sp. SRT01]|uniref:Divalent metal cation transporter MntH n=1 Tax=Sphingomonas longa TaxID=2778730 RepID=A0ABS2D8X1_9SPHN|nr:MULTISPECIES: Nramp family divalent metal transporter [Alphaproteobacteria]MBM6577348.1 Nramp family divalent metal transporter [Sphingomonas sp. BT552]MBR7710393.1 Nramp family divalent metal transporter [Microvirga sp. SRT01]
MPPPSATDALPQGEFRSLSESHRSVVLPAGAGAFRRFLAFAGPGYLVAVGYMDPGNWATDIAGGSAFGYTLLSVILLSNLMAIVLQALSARLGVASGMDLAQACRANYSKPVSIALWVLCEIAIIACDLAEVLGTAIALKLLFGLPLTWGVLVTAVDVFLILALQRFGFRRLEAFVIALLCIIAGCFVFELFLARPDPGAIMRGLVPTPAILTNPAMLYIAIGILGATVMPHNLYLHSSIVQTRAFGTGSADKREAAKMATIDSTVALGLAFFINAAILILAAATFHTAGRTDVAEIDEAYRLLAPSLGMGAASIVFAVALLASGQNSTVTGTLAGQIVMEGFLHLRLPTWARRLVTRALAIVPAVLVVGASGDAGATQLLVLSQVILSLQLPFAVVPLVMFTGRPAVMGDLVSPAWLRGLAWVITAIIIGLNGTLLYGML